MSPGVDDRVWGWKAIAAELHVHPNTAKGWRLRRVDPLPTRTGHRGVYAHLAALHAWAHRQDMSTQAADELRRLRGLVVAAGLECPTGGGTPVITVRKRRGTVKRSAPVSPE